MKNILIINGHPNKNSFCNAIAESYKESASTAGSHVVLIHLRELNFNLNLSDGYSKASELEKDLIFAQEKIKWANHIVFVHPVWWGSLPALLKGFIDRIFLPGFAFKYHDKGIMWDKLLKGKSAHIIYTSDTPNWIYTYFFNSPSVNQLKKRTLNFCGINSVKVTAISPIRKSTIECIR
jgi:NAD(P)H dehydrogenase (quinone)